MGNIAKFMGKFGISEGNATSMLGAAISSAGGGAIGSVFGPVGAGIGAITLPVLGQFAKKTAQRITVNNVKYADDLARAGSNARGVVDAYLKHTPKKSRNVSDLTDLLLDPNLNIASIRGLAKSKTPQGKLVADALFFADGIKRAVQTGASGAAIAGPGVITDEQEAPQ